MFSVMEVKREARASIRSLIAAVILVSFVFVFITQLLSYLSTKVLYGDFDVFAYFEQMMMGNVMDLPEISPAAELLDIAMSVMSYVLGVGFSYVALLISRRQKAGVGELFDVFSIFIRALCLVILKNIFITLWSLLFVIPGLIAAYRYSMAVFIMLERPDLSIMDCLRESKEMTMGSKGKLFLLDLSFLLWHALSFLVAYIFIENHILATVLTAIIIVFYLPYHQISLANVYNRLCCWRPQDETIKSDESSEHLEE